jgi:hypothetical protein
MYDEIWLAEIPSAAPQAAALAGSASRYLIICRELQLDRLCVPPYKPTELPL